MNNLQWSIVPVHEKARILADELSLPPAIARVLANRGIVSPAEAETFLFGTLAGLHNPFLMKDMDKAVERIQRALSQKERILIFGDYDVDGVLSVVILLRALRALGADADYFIPERLKEGYGLKEDHVRVVKAKGGRLVISADCGIKAVAFANLARQEGIDVIVTDHHLPGEALPEVEALLNPILQDSGYPYRNLAGVGVVFKLLQALFQKEGREASLPHYAKLVAIGTIADVAELLGENRLLVRHGLKGLENVSNRGLRSLLADCGLQNRRVTEGDVGFRIAPRINAAGRMGAADRAVRLFFSASQEEAEGLVHWLREMNSRRQSEEDRIFNQALDMVRTDSLHERYKFLVLGCESWHRGVIGIVASKLKDAFYRPVLLLSYADGMAHGSGRTISRFSLIECLDDCRDIFLDYGGHKLAVGCVLQLDRVAELKERINRVARAKLRDEDLIRKISIDAEILLSDIDVAFIEHYFRLGPFGVGNTKPHFLSRRVEVVNSPRLLRDKHLKLSVRQNGKLFEALGWDKAEWLPALQKGALINLVYSLQTSTFLGEEKLSLTIDDIGE